MAIKTVKDVVIIAEKEPRGEWDEEGREDKQPKVGTMFQSNNIRGGGAHKRKNSRFIPPLSPLPLPLLPQYRLLLLPPPLSVATTENLDEFSRRMMVMVMTTRLRSVPKIYEANIRAQAQVLGTKTTTTTSGYEF